jgi:hypothetical protein
LDQIDSNLNLLMATAQMLICSSSGAWSEQLESRREDGGLSDWGVTCLLTGKWEKNKTNGGRSEEYIRC